MDAPACRYFLVSCNERVAKRSVQIASELANEGYVYNEPDLRLGDTTTKAPNIPRPTVDKNGHVTTPRPAPGTLEAANITFNLRFPGQLYDRETGKHYNYFRDYDSSVGRYSTSDPIGLKGGISTFGYVGQSRNVAIDRLGLIKWTGDFTGVSYSNVFGGGVYMYNQTSACKCGKRVKITGMAVGGGIGWGFALGRFNPGPYGGGFGAQGFEDANACPDPEVFNGIFAIAQASAVTPIGGGSRGNILLGGAIAALSLPNSSWCSGGQYGWDLGISAFSGFSIVLDRKVTSCCN
jgi:RHS repeat-associated protein